MASSSVFVPRSDGGRAFHHGAVVGLADAAPTGRARLDAVARWLQDAAQADFVDSGLDDSGVWVLRRVALRVVRFPQFGERVALETFCSATGALWAERRTTLRGDRGGAVEAAALWIHLDPDGRRPQPLPPGFDDVYGSATAGRRVGARLTHPGEPPRDAITRPWHFRAADLDIAAHVNNTVYWAVLEEELTTLDPTARFEAEIEHRAAADRGEATIASAGTMRWLVGATGEVLATMSISPPE